MPPKLTPENIRELTNKFCATFKKFGRKPKNLKGFSIGLRGGDGYWDLVAGEYSKAELRQFTVVISIPDDLCDKPLQEALIDLAGVISTRLSSASRTINQNLGRSEKEHHDIAVNVGKNRWKKEMKKVTTDDTWYLTPYQKELFRELTAEELKTERDAIVWLARKKRLNAAQIARLSFRQIDEEQKTAQFSRGERIIITRDIRYEGTPLEKQIEKAKDDQKSSYLVFSRAARRGRVRAFTPGLKTQEVEDLIRPKRRKIRKRLWTKPKWGYIIKIKW